MDDLFIFQDPFPTFLHDPHTPSDRHRQLSGFYCVLMLIPDSHLSRFTTSHRDHRLVEARRVCGVFWLQTLFCTFSVQFHNFHETFVVFVIA